MTKRSHFQIFDLFSFELDSRYKKKNNQVSRIHNPFPHSLSPHIKLKATFKTVCHCPAGLFNDNIQKTFFTRRTTTIIVIVIIVMTASLIIIINTKDINVKGEDTVVFIALV